MCAMKNKNKGRTENFFFRNSKSKQFETKLNQNQNHYLKKMLYKLHFSFVILL